MGLDQLDRDPHDPSLSLARRIGRRLLGDPSKAPGRLLFLLVFLLIGGIVFGIWSVVTAETEPSSSSFWIVRAVASIFNTMWVLVPVAAVIYWRYIGALRTRHARAAADVTGWLAESIEQLSDEMRSTDGTTRVIATTDHSQEDIRSNVDAALRGVPHDGEVVDYFGRGTVTQDPAPNPDSSRHAERGESFETFDDAEASLPVPSEQEADSGSSRRTLRDVWTSRFGSRRARFRAVLGHVGRLAIYGAITVVATMFAIATAPFRSLLSINDGEQTEDEWDIPWKVRFAEELKHLFLDLSASLESDELMWKFGLPTGVSFAAMMLVARLWVNPILYLVFAGLSVLVGLFVFWLSKKRRSRRLRSHRRAEQWTYWDDAAGRVKAVETTDVVCYMGWISGRRYASYNRDEFVYEFSKRLYQRTHDERVSPSILEQYARNVAQMRPNLRGHLEQIERPMIQREIKYAVESSQEQVIDKAGLAMEVIEHPSEDGAVTTDLGHDPRLVAAEYRWLVEVGHVLSEVDVDFEDASGRTTTKTLVYPTEKTRLPDVEALHSQFSDRFTGSFGEPFYTLPECNPTEDLRGFVPSPRAAKMFRTEGGA